MNLEGISLDMIMMNEVAKDSDAEMKEDKNDKDTSKKVIIEKK